MHRRHSNPITNSERIFKENQQTSTTRSQRNLESQQLDFASILLLIGSLLQKKKLLEEKKIACKNKQVYGIAKIGASCTIFILQLLFDFGCISEINFSYEQKPLTNIRWGRHYPSLALKQIKICHLHIPLPLKKF